MCEFKIFSIQFTVEQLWIYLSIPNIDWNLTECVFIMVKISIYLLFKISQKKTFKVVNKRDEDLTNKCEILVLQMMMVFISEFTGIELTNIQSWSLLMLLWRLIWNKWVLTMRQKQIYDWNKPSMRSWQELPVSRYWSSQK